MEGLFLKTLSGQKTRTPPVWFMRQAGRYLPEYRDIRAQVKTFLDLCYTPSLAAEVTLQPIRRFGFDAAIIFSDILVVPDAMGQSVRFLEGEGPKLSPLEGKKSIENLSAEIEKHLAPVSESIRRVRAKLPSHVSLIGFCGAPWTVACYMIEGGSSKQHDKIRIFAQKEPESFQLLIDKICEASIRYLSMQIEAGAQAIQIFDSWAGAASHEQYLRWIIQPTRKICQVLRDKFPAIPIIGFPRASGVQYAAYAKEVPVQAIGIDYQTPLSWAKENIQQVLQGNLDPTVLVSDEKSAVQATKNILDTLAERAFIFNLGHGILPATPLAHVQAVCDTIREWRRPNS